MIAWVLGYLGVGLMFVVIAAAILDGGDECNLYEMVAIVFVWPVSVAAFLGYVLAWTVRSLRR